MEDPSVLILSMLLSTLGFGVFWYGRKQRRIPQLSVGLVMMVVPYFLPSALLVVVVGAALSGLLVLLVRAGL